MTTLNPEFTEFPKIARLSRECVITEKLDGTNASIFIPEEGPMLVGSRTRWITPEDDNYGFARWAFDHERELRNLGPGHHFGEWWGSGCQRGYGLTKGEKRFSLFNVARWHQSGAEPYVTHNQDPRIAPKTSTEAPACCHVVPVLYRGLFTTEAAQAAIDDLAVSGSKAAPGFMNPEGIIIFHTAAGCLFKKTIHKDEAPKSRH